MNADELRDAIRALPEPITAREPPYWEYWRWELWTRIVAGAVPNDFMGWPCVYHTMLVNHWKDAVAVEFEAIKNGKWLDTTRTPPVGVPSDFHDLTGYSRNLIHQAYHLSRWEAVTGRRVEDLNSIVEFGGGYGAMALVARRAGFRGTYSIIDLPEFALLQQWFLSQVGVKGVEWGELDRQRQADLLVGIYSLSEVPPDMRGEVFDCIRAGNYLFLYSAQWEMYDNDAYFHSLPIQHELWHFEEIKHLPDRGNWYAFRWEP